jgi:hypothetical protein
MTFQYSARQLSSHKTVKARSEDRWYSHKRLGGLSRFAVAITILTIVGHLFLGFEQAWIVPFIALATAYATELIGETLDAYAVGRKARYSGSSVDLVRFLLPAHITALSIAMLLYSAENFAAVAFAVSVGIASKYVFRAQVGLNAQGAPIVRHFLNPSNFAITATLLLFPTVGIAPPYQFTENTWGIVDWLLPAIIIISGSFLNIKATGRIPLILAWVTAFAAQAVIRAMINGTPLAAGLMPMTGFAFILYTFYMITDPATSPAEGSKQVIFGVAVAACYGLLVGLHIVFGLFYALTIVTAARGLWLVVSLRFATPYKAAINRQPHLSAAE